ncbi:MAG: hypothetical protein V5A64_00650 [Candidatus Thermoplasmatota archaeon]
MKKSKKQLFLTLIITFTLIITAFILYSTTNKDDEEEIPDYRDGKLYFSYDEANKSLIVEEAKKVNYEDFAFQSTCGNYTTRRFYIKDDMGLRVGEENKKEGSISVGDRLYVPDQMLNNSFSIIFLPTSSAICYYEGLNG